MTFSDLFENPLILYPLFALGFAVIFVSFWLFVTWLISRFGGWYKLAQAYAGEIPAREVNNRIKMQTARLGGSSYRNCLNISVSDHDLGLSLPLIFRAGSPPLRIPFEDISADKQPGWGAFVAITFAKVPNRKLVVRSKLAQKIESASNGRLDLTTD